MQCLIGKPSLPQIQNRMYMQVLFFVLLCVLCASVVKI